MPAWEQSYLRMIVFGNDPQANFAAAGFGEFDGAVRPYGTSSQASEASSSGSSGRATPSSSSIDSYVSPRANSLQFGFSGLSIDHPADAKSAEAFLGEGSGPNKRPHVEEVPEQPPQTGMNSGPQQEPQPLPEQRFHAGPQQFPAAAQAPAPLPNQPVYFQAAPQQPSAAPQAGEDRPKQKGKKRVGKKTEPQPMVGLFNESLGKYDQPVSIRHVLQNTKVDMTWMDLVAWSPAVCKELKRLYTRVPKKRVPKPTTGS